MRVGCLILWALYAIPTLAFAGLYAFDAGCLFTCDTGDYSWAEYFSEPINLIAFSAIVLPPLVVLGSYVWQSFRGRD